MDFSVDFDVRTNLRENNTSAMLCPTASGATTTGAPGHFQTQRKLAIAGHADFGRFRRCPLTLTVAE